MGGNGEYKRQRKGGKKVSPLRASSRQTTGMSKKKLETEEIESDDGAVEMSEATMDEIVKPGWTGGRKRSMTQSWVSTKWGCS